jgi:hypothetical protein
MINKIHLNKIVIASDLTGMIMAPILGAIFIPVSFSKSFGWEYDQNIDISLINLFRNINRRKMKGFNVERQYTICQDDNTEYIKCFYWEIEDLYKYLLLNTSMIYEGFNIKSANNFVKNQINFNTNYGTELIVTFDKCWIINPSDSWFRTNLEYTQKISSNNCHVISHLVIRKDTDDMKGVVYSNDIEICENEYFDKIWYSGPFGVKRYLLGNNPRTRTKTVSTRNICFIKQDVNVEDIDNEEHSAAEIRKNIYNKLCVYNKRIAERYYSFEKNINKIIVSTNIDIYENTDNIEFIYYNDKKDIICQKNINYANWSHSYLQHLYQITDSTISSMYSNQFIKTSQ